MFNSWCRLACATILNTCMYMKHRYIKFNNIQHCSQDNKTRATSFKICMMLNQDVLFVKPSHSTVLLIGTAFSSIQRTCLEKSMANALVV